MRYSKSFELKYEEVYGVEKVRKKLGLNKEQFNRRKNMSNRSKYYVFADARSEVSLYVDFVNRRNPIERCMYESLTMMINNAIMVEKLSEVI